MKALLRNSEGRYFLYSWKKQTQTVNVWTTSKEGKPVNFDVFTSDQLTSKGFWDHCAEHLADREQADARYQGEHTGDELLYGVLD
jgi:hypothetical protein